MGSGLARGERMDEDSKVGLFGMSQFMGPLHYLTPKHEWADSTPAGFSFDVILDLLLIEFQ